MAIPDSQLETWSRQGSVTQSSNTYNAIKNVLESADTPYAGKSYKVFLQGSYGNDTNIYAESDVDIVIRLDDCWSSDLEALTPPEKDAYKRAFVDATYTHVAFKRDVLAILTDKYGSDVKSGAKAIAVAASGNRRRTDVIAATQFRRYYKFNGISDQSYVEGICFYTAAGERIANYPKQHSTNLTSKHQNTNKWLKPIIRVLKNLREKLVDDNRIEAGVAPSYFLEGLLYNVPNGKFTTSLHDCFVNSMNWIQNEADKSKLVCVNEQLYLLRGNSRTSLSEAKCATFIDAAIELWNDW